METAMDLFDSHLLAIRDRRGRLLWYDLGSADQYSAWFVERAVRYLTQRRMLRRHPSRSQYVKWRAA